MKISAAPPFATGRAHGRFTTITAAASAGNSASTTPAATARYRGFQFAEWPGFLITEVGIFGNMLMIFQPSACGIA